MTDLEITNELIKRLRGIDLSGLAATTNHWHSALVCCLATVILENAKDYEDAGHIIFETNKFIERIVLNNRVWFTETAG